ncbi:MAG TPA: alpha-E domain-containing protein [Hyphomicrobiaceae bacterium]|nr:alpha-E domain-containing protein [Hyphomicrobiaceae bacterium]
MTALLSRYAECLFWFGRYTERTACLARVLEVQTSFNRSNSENAAGWAWLLTLYDDHEAFNKSYDRPDAQSVTRFYVSDRDNPGSLYACIHAARENARTLRALISTDLWYHVNAFYNRFRTLPPSDLSENRLSQTCQMVKKECYAQLGVAEATLYRDDAWRFYQLGMLVERADQTSRLLDVRFAQIRESGIEGMERLGDFGFWSVLLRASAAHQAYLRTHGGRREPELVARFLILDTAQPRSVTFCANEMDRVLNELRSASRLRVASRTLEQIDILREQLVRANSDKQLVEGLHTFNDAVQRQLIQLSSELSYAFFGAERPNEQGPDTAQSQTASAGNNDSQSQSQSSR